MDNERERCEDTSQVRPRVYVAIGLLVAVAGSVGIAALLLRDQPAPALSEPAGHPPAALKFATEIERGAHLFQTNGCFVCHGAEGRGGVVNENFAGGTVPALNVMAERMMLFEPEDAQAAIGLIEAGTDLASVNDPPFPGYARFLAQYNAVRWVIENERLAGSLDPAGPTPHLQMPSFGARFDDQATNAIVAYLISLYPWDEEEDIPMEDEASLEGQPDEAAPGEPPTTVSPM